MARRLPTWLTKPERKRLLDLDLSDRDRAIVTTMLYAGLRSNELRMLDVEDIDFQEMTIFVSHGKRDKQRLIPLHADIAAAIDAHLTPGQTGAVFLSSRGQRISNRRLRSLIGYLGGQAGLRKRIHPHALRHPFAVSLREVGEELDVIKTLLGHEKIETTSIYTHCSVTQLRMAVERL